MLVIASPYPAGPLLEDAFTAANGAAWDPAKWASTFVQQSGVIDIQSNQGRLRAIDTNNSRAGAIAAMEPVFNSRVKMKYRFSSIASAAAFRVFIRASGVWATAPTAPTRGYGIRINNDGNPQLQNIGSTSPSVAVATASFTHDTTQHRLILEVEGQILRCKIHKLSNAEPANWTMQAEIASEYRITTPGVMQLVHHREASGPFDVFIDDLVVTAL